MNCLCVWWVHAHAHTHTHTHTQVTFVLRGISVLNAQVVALHIQLHVGEDELLLDQLPDDPAARK